MHSSISRSLLLAATAPVVFGQNITVDNTTVEATSDNVATAAEGVSTTSNSTASYFSSESAQLTDSVIANLTGLNLTGIDLFGFDTTENSAAAKRGVGSICKHMPGDLLYPNWIIWKVFDLLLGGALMQPVPLAAPCYNDHPEETDAWLCSYITANWENNSYIHSDDPTSIMWPLYEGRTCMPTDYPTDSCTQGAYPEYVVNASTVAQIQLAVNFARNANLRLVVKNTGHDFNGKSAGAGALSIWTHNLKSVEFYEDLEFGGYAGPAFKLGTGVQADELYEAANKYGYTAIGGEGRSVGVSGGFLLGGGHSPMSSMYGMAADHVLSMEVVTPSGEFVTASETSSPDLFWALRGGGGGTYGVVTSVLVKVFPKTEVATMTFSFSTGTNVSADAFWAGVRAYFGYIIEYVDAGCYEYFSLVQTGADSYYFGMAPWWAPNMTIAELKELVAPWFADLEAVGITVEPEYQYFTDFYDAWYAIFPLETAGTTVMKTASRLWPKSSWDDATSLNATFEAIRETVELGGSVLAFNIQGVGKAIPDYPDTSISPHWRETCLHAILAAFWDEDSTDEEIAEVSRTLTEDWMGIWRNASVGAGSYMSEGDVDEPDFQDSFYGDSYERLYELKQKIDPWMLMYTPTGVGSEDWYVTDQIDYLTTQNGRLCKA
ncbi:putative fad binding domain protein [Zalerion maritima]|uniref:Fad binding domain protein n=1 Tax=Zalerion maritima TaxID=339359 RepID=A0AAD5RQX6_9PEZI|nr:putative fad binding domain protein [Zalerion maritima]